MVKYYIIIGIIYTIPYIVTIVISGLRKKLETDRNFYGKTIDIQKIELTNVSYKKFEIARNNIKKYTEMGEIKYVYDRSYDFEDERLLLSEKEYQKCFPDKFVKTTVAYYIIFEFSYETDIGYQKRYESIKERYKNDPERLFQVYRILEYLQIHFSEYR